MRKVSKHETTKQLRQKVLKKNKNKKEEKSLGGLELDENEYQRIPFSILVKADSSFNQVTKHKRSRRYDS